MRVKDPNCAHYHRESLDPAQANSGFAELVSDDLPVFHRRHSNVLRTTVSVVLLAAAVVQLFFGFAHHTLRSFQQIALASVSSPTSPLRPSFHTAGVSARDAILGSGCFVNRSIAYCQTVTRSLCDFSKEE
jgi:hypothetical protein